MNRFWLFLTLFLAAAFGAGSWIFYARHHTQARREVQNELAAIADLKSDQIMTWLKDRRGDAALAGESRLVRRYLANPADEALRAELAEWMVGLERSHDYGAVALFDSAGDLRLDVPPDVISRYSCAAENANDGLRASAVVLTDLHRAHPGGPIHMSLMVPIVSEDPSAPAAAGVLLMIVDPGRFLYPLIQKWPTPSRTAETLLVRREDDEVVFINELRHRAGTALSFRLSLRGHEDLPAAQAVQGFVGVLEGHDYRGVPVVAATRKIEGLPWYIVAKVDQAEVYAPARRETRTVAAIIALLFLATIAAIALNSRHQALKRVRRELAEGKLSEKEARSAENQAKKLLEASEESQAVLLSVIEDQKAVEKALRESESRFRELFERISSGVAVYEAVDGGRDFVIKDFNAAGERIERISRERVVGRRVTEVFPGVEAFGLLDAFRRVWRTGKAEDFPASEYKDGRISGWRENHVFKLPSGEVVAAYDDVTARKEAEKRLRESEERFRSLYENATIGLYRTTPAGRIILANPTLVKMLGYSSFDELAGRDLETDGYAPSYPRSVFLGRMAGEGRVDDLEAVWIRKDGTEIHVKESASAFRDERGEILFYDGTVEDITEFKREEEELRRIEAQLQQQQRLESIGTLASGVAHEVNNPINGIMNYAQLLADGLEEGDPRREYAAEITKEGERISEIVRHLLAFSRQERQSHSPASLRDIVNATLSLIRTVIRHDQIRLEVEIAEDLPKIKCRSQQIQQVLLNLLTNARDALNEKFPGHDEEKVIRISVRPFLKDGKPWIRTAVENYGVPVPPAVRERIFEPFFTTKPRDKGTGLGLSISYRIVKDHGGELYLDSGAGQPTRFHMDLPVENGWNLEA